jgi:hypothetical protein
LEVLVKHSFHRHVVASLLSCTALTLVGAGTVAALPTPRDSGKVYAPSSRPFGTTYSDWSVKLNQWGLALPLAGHPYLDTPDYDVTEGQTGKVWYLPGVFGSVTRNVEIPAGESLSVLVAGSEYSSLEGFPTEADQRATAQWATDHFVPSSLFCTIDGVPVDDLADFRFQSRQFSFTAPSPWIFGDTGGSGTAVSDGYFVILKALKAGQHTIHFGGSVHFAIADGDPFDFDASIDMTYAVTQD